MGVWDFGGFLLNESLICVCCCLYGWEFAVLCRDFNVSEQEWSCDFPWKFSSHMRLLFMGYCVPRSDLMRKFGRHLENGRMTCRWPLETAPARKSELIRSRIESAFNMLMVTRDIECWYSFLSILPPSGRFL
jgi:hypothetical protein